MEYSVQAYIYKHSNTGSRMEHTGKSAWYAYAFLDKQQPKWLKVDDAGGNYIHDFYQVFMKYHTQQMLY